MLRWDELAFRERVMECARAIGIDSLREVARLARLEPKYFRDDIENLPDGRNIKHVFLIADALNADPAYLLGLADSAHPPSEEDQALDKIAFVASIAAHLYAALARRPPPNPAVSKKLVKMLVELIDYADPPQSS